MTGDGPIDSPESARAAARGWIASGEPISKMEDLIRIFRRCRNEEGLRYLVEALVAALRTRTKAMPRPLWDSGTRAPQFLEMEAEPKVPPPRRMPSAPPSAKPASPIAPAAAPAPEVLPVFGAIEFVEIQADPPAPVLEMPPRAAEPEPEPEPPPPPRPPPVRAPVLIGPGEEPKRATKFTAAPPPPLPTAPETIPVIDPAKLMPGVDAEILADILRVGQCRRIFESTNHPIEEWEVFCLVMMEGDLTRVNLERILALRAVNDTKGFAEGSEALYQKLLALRARFGPFVEQVRDFVSKLPIGRFGKETTDMALGFLVVSTRGREAAARWINDPKRSEPEAAGRWEGLIATSMRYQAAINSLKK